MQETILFVDDEESMRYTAEKFLSRRGFNFLSAETYTEAIKYISRTDINLIISDIHIKEYSGIELLREIKARGIQSPVIMMAGHRDRDTAAEALRLGAFDSLIKPFRMDVLLKSINRALQNNRAEASNTAHKERSCAHGMRAS